MEKEMMNDIVDSGMLFRIHLLPEIPVPMEHLSEWGRYVKEVTPSMNITLIEVFPIDGYSIVDFKIKMYEREHVLEIKSYRTWGEFEFSFSNFQNLLKRSFQNE